MSQVRNRPALLQAMLDAFTMPDLRRKILFTLGMLVVFRFVAHVPLPGVNLAELHRLFTEIPILGMLDLFSGGALRSLSIAALGVYPYITASIIMQLLVPIIPRLQALSREGEAGRNKINQITHWATVPLAALQGYGLLMTFQGYGVFRSEIGLSAETALPTIAMLLSLIAGTMFLVWLGERITENGIGNGISIIIFGGIIAALPGNIWQTFQTTGSLGILSMLIVLLVAIAFLIVFVTEAQRRIPVQYSRSLFRGGRMYRQTGGTYIPMKVNSAGMIPLIFAMAVIMFPGIIATWLARADTAWVASLANWISHWFGTTSGLYWGLYFLLVVSFAFFYTMVIFQQQNLAGTLQQQGGFVPGIRPGKPTEEYLTRVTTRITWGGAIFLGVVAIIPLVSMWIAGTPGNISIMILSSAGLLIVVGVVLDTMRQLEAQLLMRRYEGFLK